MTLTDQTKEALDIAAETRTLLLACIKEPTAKKLVKANAWYSQRMIDLQAVENLIKKLYKQNREDLKDIVRLENDI